jgi:hypothetical protein
LVAIMSLTNHLLFAANLEDVIKAAVPIIVMVLWGLGQLMSAKPKAKPPAPRPPQPMDGGRGGAPAQGGKPATLEESLRREVEEFMRRAQGRPAEPPKRPAGKQPPPRREGRPAGRPAAEPPERTRRLTDAPGGLTTPQSSSTPPTGASVGQHVAEHLGRSTQELAAHSRTLGADVAQADERLESHLKQKFQHQVGALEHRTSVGPTQRARTPIAQSIFDMLKRPDGVKQAVVLGEILRRPDERWNSSRGSHET